MFSGNEATTALQRHVVELGLFWGKTAKRMDLGRFGGFLEGKQVFCAIKDGLECDGLALDSPCPMLPTVCIIGGTNSRLLTTILARPMLEAC